MNKKIRILNNICYIIMEILVMTVLFLFPQALINEGNMIRYYGIIILCMLAISDYILKIYCDNFIIYILGHSAFFFIILIAGFPFVEMIPLELIALFQLIFSVYYWGSEIWSSSIKLLKMPLYPVLTFILVEIISTAMKLGPIIIISYLLGFIFMILYFTILHFTNMLDFFDRNTESKNTPFTKVFRMNTKYKAVLFVLSFVLILITNMPQALRVLRYLWYGIRYLFSLLLWLLLRPGKLESLPEPDNEVPGDGPDLPPLQAPNPYVQFLFSLIAYIITLTTIAVLIYILYLWFIALLNRNIRKMDMIDFIEPIVKNDKRKIVKRKKLSSLLTGKTNNLKIRRIYYKKIKGYKDNLIVVAPYDTPEEINDKIEAKTETSISNLTKLYEQARYGSKELTKDDVEKAKSDK